MDEPGSRRLENGSKARQRQDSEDRNLPFSNALRLFGIPATDIDFVVTNGKDCLRVAIEATRPDVEVYSENYLKQIDERRRDSSNGNHNDSIISLIGNKLGVKTILVVFEPDICENPDGSRCWWRDIDATEWKSASATTFLKKLRDYALNSE